MTELIWDAVGERVYEAGVDRGVLYVDDKVAPWVGLVSISEATTGGERTPYYLDGVMYLNLSADTEYAATIEAYTYPDEFAECDGSIELANGFIITNQDRKAFNLSYRTLIGNDVDGRDFGYKIHLVYNATVSPSEYSYSTVGEMEDASLFSWNIEAVPTELDGYKPTAHFIIDSRKITSEHLGYLEDILYGRSGSSPVTPRLPTFEEIMIIVSNPLEELDYFDGGAPDEGSTWSIKDAGSPTSVPTAARDAGDIAAGYDGGAPSTVTFDNVVDGGTP